jgi:uncharacterized protein
MTCQAPRARETDLATDVVHAPPVVRRFWPGVGLAFALAAVLLAYLFRAAPWMSTFSATFVSIVLEALPFIALGALLSGLLEVFVSSARVTRFVPRRRLPAVLVAASLGLLLPVCGGAGIPGARRPVRKGVPFSVAIAYLVGGPIVNPIVAASTAVAYAGDWLMVVTRLGCGLGVAVAVGLIVERLYPGHAALRRDAFQAEAAACGCAPLATAPQSVFRRLLAAGACATDDFLSVSQFLIIGAFLAALSQALIARDAFLTLAANPPASILAMMGLAVGLNLCSEADAFVAASFRNSLPLAAQLAFIVLGPMLDLKLIAMYLSFVRPRAVLTIALLMILLVFGIALALVPLGWGALA